VAELATHFDVTESTIRRDLAALQARNVVRRTHGGALLVRSTEASADAKNALHRAEKRAIGQAMAHRILDGQSVLLDSGSTTLEVARQLSRRRLTIVTNDLRIGSAIAQRGTAHLVFIGGELLPNSHNMWGPASVEQLRSLRVNVAVFGADTVTEDGIYASSSYELELKRTMRDIAQEAFFVADSSKFGREALFKIFGFGSVTAGITDEYMSPMRAAQFPVPLIRARVG
jgi:DeoR/GlpR family transcriptional regulator of sugar metabolism